MLKVEQVIKISSTPWSLQSLCHKKPAGCQERDLSSVPLLNPVVSTCSCSDLGPCLHLYAQLSVRAFDPTPEVCALVYPTQQEGEV